MSGWAVRHRTTYRPSFNTADDERFVVAGCMSSGTAHHNSAIERTRAAVAAAAVADATIAQGRPPRRVAPSRATARRMI